MLENFGGFLMSNSQLWRQNSDPIYAQFSKVKPHRLISELGLEPITFLDAGLEVSSLPQIDTDYVNFCQAHSHEIDVLKEDHQFGLIVGHEKSWEGLAGIKHFYFKSTPVLTPEKLNGLKKMDSMAMINLGIEPYTLGLWKSQLYSSPSDIESLKKSDHQNMRLFRLSSQTFDLAGASSPLQVALLMLSFLQLIEDYKGDFTADEILSTLSFEVTLTGNILADTVKIEAFKLLFLRLIEILGYDEGLVSPVFCTPSLRYLSVREPWTNLLRFSSMNMASRMAQSSGFIHLSHDLFSQNSENRLSYNIDLIARHEAYLDKVKQPWVGSGSFHQFIEKFCDRSWLHFKELTKKGGLISGLRSGWIQNEIEITHLSEISDFLNRDIKLTGVNQYVLNDSLGSDYPLTKESEQVSLENWWVQQKDFVEVDSLCEVQKLTPYRLCDNFEQWQYKADQYREKNKKGLRALFHIESGLEKSPKVTMSKERLNLAAIETKTLGDIKEFPIHVVVAGDPGGDYVRLKVEELKDQKLFVIWAGEKELKEFNQTLGLKTDLQKLFEDLFSFLDEV